MKFLTMVKSPETSEPPPQALMDAINRLGEEATAAGVLVTVGGLFPSVAGAQVRLSKGQLAVTDGPFTEAKELIGGFAMYSVPSRDEAIAWTKRFLDLHREHWPGWEGAVEIRQMYEPGNAGC